MLCLFLWDNFDTKAKPKATINDLLFQKHQHGRLIDMM